MPAATLVCDSVSATMPTSTVLLDGLLPEPISNPSPMGIASVVEENGGSVQPQDAPSPSTDDLPLLNDRSNPAMTPEASTGCPSSDTGSTDAPGPKPLLLNKKMPGGFSAPSQASTVTCT